MNQFDLLVFLCLERGIKMYLLLLTNDEGKTSQTGEYENIVDAIYEMKKLQTDSIQAFANDDYVVEPTASNSNLGIGIKDLYNEETYRIVYQDCQQVNHEIPELNDLIGEAVLSVRNNTN